MAAGSLEQLQERIAYRFQNLELLREALTHSSHAQEQPHAGRDNQLMEFLGDAVLTFLITTHLVRTFPDFDEGQLSRLRASLVSAPHLAQVAAMLGLGRYLRLGRSEEKTGGREKFGILVDAVEALLAAVYCDGGLEPARALVETFILPSNLPKLAVTLSPDNHKGALQEYLQARRLGPAQYRVVEENGLEHQKVFVVEVKVNETLTARGWGNSKKAASQQAAWNALRQLKAGERAGE
jgi:ribonuclease-3